MFFFFALCTCKTFSNTHCVKSRWSETVLTSWKNIYRYDVNMTKSTMRLVWLESQINLQIRTSINDYLHVSERYFEYDVVEVGAWKALTLSWLHVGIKNLFATREGAFPHFHETPDESLAWNHVILIRLFLFITFSRVIISTKLRQWRKKFRPLMGYSTLLTKLLQYQKAPFITFWEMLTTIFPCLWISSI